MYEPHVVAALSALITALDKVDEPYVPTPVEAKHLEAALAHLIAVFDGGDFEAGEEAVWNCGTITIGGQHRGAWEIKLRQTDCDSGSHSKSRDV